MFSRGSQGAAANPSVANRASRASRPQRAFRPSPPCRSSTARPLRARGGVPTPSGAWTELKTSAWRLRRCPDPRRSPCAREELERVTMLLGAVELGLGGAVLLEGLQKRMRESQQEARDEAKRRLDSETRYARALHESRERMARTPIARRCRRCRRAVCGAWCATVRWIRCRRGTGATSVALLAGRQGHRVGRSYPCHVGPGGTRVRTRRGPASSADGSCCPGRAAVRGPTLPTEGPETAAWQGFPMKRAKTSMARSRRSLSVRASSMRARLCSPLSMASGSRRWFWCRARVMSGYVAKAFAP